MAGPVAVSAALINEGYAEVSEPIARLDFNDWAEENLVFGAESPMPGPYRASNIPLMTRILDCLSSEHPARVVTVMGAAQMFKTTVAQIFISATLVADPCDILYCHPTHAKQLSRNNTSQYVAIPRSPRVTQMSTCG